MLLGVSGNLSVPLTRVVTDMISFFQTLTLGVQSKCFRLREWLSRFIQATATLTTLLHRWLGCI